MDPYQKGIVVGIFLCLLIILVTYGYYIIFKRDQKAKQECLCPQDHYNIFYCRYFKEGMCEYPLEEKEG